MTTNHIKLYASVTIAAVIGVSIVAQQLDPAVVQQPGAQGSVQGSSNAAQPATATQPDDYMISRRGSGSSWWSSIFEGMEFKQNKGTAPAPQSPPAPVVTPVSAPRAAAGFGSVVLKADAGGHYQAQIEIEGQRIPMLVDTGATIVALRSEDAARLGLNPAPADFTISISTANGELRAARATLREVRLENILVTDVPAVIMPQGALGQSLLGMSFMKKLSSFQSAGGELVLKP